MTAVAELTCHPSSHPFQERRLELREPVKIGRSVAKARPTPDNLIFDCKVLSRNHAVLSYDKETGKFYLQDTKSSNGTFINNQRLSKGSEESPAIELNSGDIIQFGVDVVDTSKRVVVTHGRIVAQVTLYNPDGSEAIRSTPAPALQSPNDNQGPTNNNVVSQELFQLSCFLKEALYREQMLEQKLTTLQGLVSNTQEASENGWQALIDEDRLISRLEVLENQLRAYSKANSEESIRKELAQLQEDKHSYETMAKESLKKALEEKLEACRKFADMERELHISKEECSHVLNELDDLHKEQGTLLEKYSNSMLELKNLSEALSEAERKHLEELEQMNDEKRSLEERVTKMEENERSMSRRLEALQKGDQNIVKSSPSKGKETEEDSNSTDLTSHDQHLALVDKTVNGTIHLLPELKDRDAGDGAETTDKEIKPMVVNGDANETESDHDITYVLSKPDEKSHEEEENISESLERLKEKLRETEEQLEESENKASQLDFDISQAQMETAVHMGRIQELEAQLKEAEEKLSDLQSRAAAEDTSLFSNLGSVNDSGTLKAFGRSKSMGMMADLTVIQNHVDKEYIAQLQQKHSEQMEHEYKEIEYLKKEMQAVEERCKRLIEENEIQKKNLENSQAENRQYAQENTQLQEQLKKSITAATTVKKEIMELRDQLKLEKQASKVKESAAQHAEDCLDLEKKVSQERKRKLEEVEKNFSDAQHSHRNKERDVGKLQDQINKLTEELEREKAKCTDLEKEYHRLSSIVKEFENEKCDKNKIEEEKQLLQKKIEEMERISFVNEEVLQQSRGIVTETIPTANHISERKDSSSEVHVLKQRNEDLQKRLTSAEEKLSESRLQVNRLTESVASYEKRLKEREPEKNKVPGYEDFVDGKPLPNNENSELSRAFSEIERLKSESEKSSEEQDKLLRELERIQNLNGADNIVGIPVNQVPIVVICIAVFAALVQNILALWTAE